MLLFLNESVLLAFSVEILLKPTGSAPIINKNKWSLGAEKRVSYILYWLHSYFKLDAEEKIVSSFQSELTFPSHQCDVTAIFFTDDCLSIAVFVCESNIRSGSRSNHKESIRMLRNQWQADITLLKEPGVGLKFAFSTNQITLHTRLLFPVYG